MATKTATKPAFTIQKLDLAEVGRTLFVVRDSDNHATAVTFSEAKAGRIVAFRTEQLAQVTS